MGVIVQSSNIRLCILFGTLLSSPTILVATVTLWPINHLLVT